MKITIVLKGLELDIQGQVYLAMKNLLEALTVGAKSPMSVEQMLDMSIDATTIS